MHRFYTTAFVCTACVLHVHVRVHCMCMCMCTACALDCHVCTVQVVATLVGATLPKLEAHFISLGVPLEILASQARCT